MNNEGYMLIVENNNYKSELDWTKSKKFSYLKEVKHEFHFIDMFTKHFKDKDELLKFLYENKILKIHSENIELKIIHFKIQNDNYIFDEDPLINELLFQDTGDLIYKTDILLSTFKRLIQKRDFARLLQKYYVEDGEYNQNTIDKYQSQLKCLENALQNNSSDVIKFEYDLTNSKLIETRRIYELIEELLVYNIIINDGTQLTNSNYIAFNEAINNFVIGQKYYVSTENKFNTLTIDKNEDGNNRINYPELHKLIALIQIYQQKLNYENNIAKRYMYLPK